MHGQQNIKRAVFLFFFMVLRVNNDYFTNSNGLLAFLNFQYSIVYDVGAAILCINYLPKNMYLTYVIK